MKLFILQIALFTLCSCSNSSREVQVSDPEAVALNDSAVAIMMKFRVAELDSAHLLLDKSIATDPDYFIAYSNKVSVYCRQKNFEKAVETAKHLERIEPENPEGIFTLGVLLEKTGQLEEAGEKYKKAVSINKEKLESLNPKDDEYRSIQANYALHLIFAHREEEGREEVVKILKSEPGNIPAKMIFDHTREEILQQLTAGN